MFPHRLRVWRDTGQRDRFGNRDMQVAQTQLGLQGMAQIAEDIQCRMREQKGAVTFEERSTLVFVTQTVIYVEPSADVLELDRVQVYEPVHSGIIIPDGIVKLKNPVYGQYTLHHLELYVEVIRSPQ